MSEVRSSLVVGKAAASAVAILALAVIGVRAVGIGVERLAPTHDRKTLGQLRRTALAMDAAAAGIGDTAFIGTSRTQFGFDPVAFEATLAERGEHVTALNFGFIPLLPEISRGLVDRMCDSGGRKLLLYEVAPEDWTVKPDPSDPYATIEDAVADLTARPGDVARHPLHVVVGHALGRRAPFAIAEALKNAAFDDPGPPWAAAFNAFLDVHRPFDRVDYTTADHGFLRLASDDGRRLYAAWAQIQQTDASFERHREDAEWDGIPAMKIDPEAVARSIALLRELGRCSAHVVLVTYPLHPRLRAAMTPDAVQRLHETVATIARATGFWAVDLFDDPGFAAPDFADGVHMNLTRGAERFSRLLATRVAELLH